MELDFWQERWRNNEIGFHQDKINPYLQSFWDSDGITKTSTVLVPLCGKSSDMVWLRDQGYRVIGVEISPIAVRDFFVANNISRLVQKIGKFEVHSGDNIALYCGDFFELTHDDVAECAAVYDRAALVALPREMRVRYVKHIQSILPAECRILLVTMEYPQEQMDGPPFCVSDEEVHRHFGNNFHISKLNSLDILQNNARFRERGLSRLVENTFAMRPK